ncbi:MAG: hypothetical protein HY663_01475 [Chloroflexi bacterium]|nr:hypothetical protein [Chloroflexota bacterium]
MEILKSAISLICGTIKRVQWYLPPLLLDPFDVVERLWGVSYPIPQWVAWALFGLGWFVAIVVTYHELRMQKIVLERRLEQEIDPIKVEQRKQHFTRLADIADSLLSGRLKDIQEGVDPQDKDESRPMYAVFTEYNVDMLEEYSLTELVDRLGSNLDSACYKFGKWDVMDCFQPHLKAESSEVESKGIKNTISENPLELIGTLRILSSRKTFKGTCPVCKGWTAPNRRL